MKASKTALILAVIIVCTSNHDHNYAYSKMFLDFLTAYIEFVKEFYIPIVFVFLGCLVSYIILEGFISLLRRGKISPKASIIAASIVAIIVAVTYIVHDKYNFADIEMFFNFLDIYSIQVHHRLCICICIFLVLGYSLICAVVCVLMTILKSNKESHSNRSNKNKYADARRISGELNAAIKRLKEIVKKNFGRSKHFAIKLTFN
jgi:hypothetical protein